MNCKPKSFYGNKGVVGLTRWIDKMESVFEISFYDENHKVRFVACTFVDATLTWWNSHAKTLGTSNANAMSWSELKQLLIDEYCPRDEMQKIGARVVKPYHEG